MSDPDTASLDTSKRTSIAIPEHLRDALRIIAAFEHQTLAAATSIAIAEHVNSYLKRHPELRPHFNGATHPSELR